MSFKWPARSRNAHLAEARAVTRERASSGQSVVEFVLVLPIIFLLLGAAIDFGRLFYAYVAVENAAKEGALVGARYPLCNLPGASSGCADPNNVVWHVENEAPNLVDSGGNSLLTSAVACRRPNGSLVQPISDCLDGDTYQVTVSTGFKMITPLLSGLVPSDFTLTKIAQATVITDAFDPSGLEVLLWVNTTGASGSSISTITSPGGCTPADGANPGFYYQPCQDQKNVDNYLQFDELTAGNPTIASYRVRVRNTGNVDLTGITYSFSENGTAVGTKPGNCSTLPTSMLKTAAAVYCSFTAPTKVTDPTTGINDDTWAIQTTAMAGGLSTGVGSAGATIKVAPAPRLAINLKASPYRLGGTGNGVSGTPSYPSGNLTLSRQPTSTLPEIVNPTGWFELTVQNKGGDAANFLVAVTQQGSPIALPGCTIPATLTASGQPGDTFTCTFPRTFTATQAYSLVASASATNALIVAGQQPSVMASTATCAQKVVPNLVDTLDPAADGSRKTVSQAGTVWTQAGFTGALTVTGLGTDVRTQNRTAYTCSNANTTVTVTAP